MRYYPPHHRIFAAMTPQQELTSRDVWHRCRRHLPPGWNFNDVVQALRKFRDEGAVEVDRIRGVSVYRRVEGFAGRLTQPRQQETTHA